MINRIECCRLTIFIIILTLNCLYEQREPVSLQRIKENLLQEKIILSTL